MLLKKEAQLSFGHNDIGTFSLFTNQNSFKFINYLSEFSNSPPHAAQQFSVKKLRILMIMVYVGYSTL